MFDELPDKPEPKDEFADLEPEVKPDDPKEPDPAALKAENERLKAEKDTIEAKRRDLESAMAETRRKNKELKAKLKETVKDDDPDPEPEDKKTPEDITKIVEDTLSEKEKVKYKQGLVAEIKAKAKTREEAELILHYAERLPETSGDPAEDVRRAFAWSEAIRRDGGSVIPSPLSGGRPESREFSSANRMTKEEAELTAAFGHSAEDLAKYSGEIKL